MGFPFPAEDYIQRRLTVNDLVVHNPLSTLFIERDERMLAVDRAAWVKREDKVALVYDGVSLIARTGDRCLITDDGQKIAGDALDGVVTLGKVTYEIMSVWRDNGPV